MELKIIYQDENILVVDKPPSIIVFPEKPLGEKTLIDFLLKEFPYLKKVGKPPRYGIVHRLDKETSGILLVAKNNESLSFLQGQFKDREVIKKYVALVNGKLKKTKGEIETLIGRSPKNRMKQKVYFPLSPGAKGKRSAVTKYRTLSYFYQISRKGKNHYTLVEATPKTGRKHQIRTHFNYLGYPLAGDKLYSFKNQTLPEKLKRHFLHANFLKIKLIGGKEKEFSSQLPKDLKDVLAKLNEDSK